jgi:DNA polymerase III epsilon subunit-like protein
MLSLIYDTETTGMYNFKGRPGDANQPEVLQLCAKISQDGKIVSSINVFVRGEKEIEEKAYEVHRISRDFANAVGISRRKMVLLFQDMAEQCDVLVGHNVGFDEKMLTSAMIKEGGTGKIFQSKASYCTMHNSTDLCKIPSPKKPGSYKWPSLAEAYAILVDPRGFSNAHDAEADVLATHEVYRVLMAQKNG